MNDTETELSELLHEHTPEPPASIDLPGLAAQARAGDVPGPRRWLLPTLAAAAVVAIVAGALTAVRLTGDLTGDDRPGTTAPPSLAGTPAGSDPNSLAMARKWVQVWESRTGDFVPVDAWQFQRVGAWPAPSGADRWKALALDARLIANTLKLPATGSRATIRWDDGRTQQAATFSAAATFQRLLTINVPCPGCADLQAVRLASLTLTTATPATMRVRTSRGMATVPAWRFGFAGTRVQVLQAAVRSDIPVKVQPDDSPQIAHQIEKVAVAPDGSTLTVTFFGMPAGNGPCSENYTGYAVQSAHVVGIGVDVVPRPHPSPVPCMAPAVMRTLTLRLDQPLGDRVVIETMRGTPVPVDR